MILRKLFIGGLFPEGKEEQLRQRHMFVLKDKKIIFYARIFLDWCNRETTHKMMLRRLFIGGLFPEGKEEQLRQRHMFVLKGQKVIFYAQIILD